MHIGQDFVILFNGWWEPVTLPISGFNIYRGRRPIYKDGFWTDLIVPPKEVKEVSQFRWDKIAMFCIQTTDSYDDAGRYRGASGNDFGTGSFIWDSQSMTYLQLTLEIEEIGKKPDKKIKKNIILLGDSSVETSHRLNEMPENYLRNYLNKTNVISFASWGWATDQQYIHLKKYIEETGSNVFDFSTFYKLEEALDRYEDLTYLDKEMLWQTYPEKAVTFTANHDTEKDSNEDNFIMAENKLIAYAYILTHPGYPTIFYSDYENEAFQEEIKQLITIHNSLAIGETEILYVDADEYIMKRKGTSENPGLIIYINTSDTTKRRTVKSNWINSTLIDYSLNSTYAPYAKEDGEVNLEAPGKGYAVWSTTTPQE